MKILIKEMVKKEVEKVFAAGGQATFSSTRTNEISKYRPTTNA